MTKQAEILAEYRRSFARRWGPPLDQYEEHDFQIDLDHLIYAAVQLGQEPFVRELTAYREAVLKGMTYTAS